MKKLISLILALLMAASLVACTGETEGETLGDTTVETSLETNDETEGETLGETDVSQVTELFGNRFPTGTEPSVIYLTNAGGTVQEQVLLSSLQGLAAKETDEHIYYGDASGVVFPYMQKLKPDVQFVDTVDGEPCTVWPLVKHFAKREEIKGYILCTESNPESVDIAISLAGLLDALVVIDTIEPTVKEIGYSCVLDVREYDDAWLRQSEYWNQLRRDMAFQQSYTLSIYLIDWAVFSGGSYFTNYTGYVAEEQKAKYEFLDDNAIIFGYNHSLGEGVFIQAHSDNNISLLPSDFMSNLSAVRSFSQESMVQPRGDVDSTAVENVHTVTFVYSDGDNMCFASGGMVGMYNHARKGEFALGWGIPATSIDLMAPTVSYYYDTKTDNDEFVMSLSGMAYTYPTAWSDEARAEMSAEVAYYMKRTDLRYMIMLDDAVGAWSEKTFSDFTEHDGIDGIFYVGLYNRAGSVVWTNGKPTVGCRMSVGYDQIGAAYNAAAKFLSRKTLCVDVKKTRGYSMYYLICWNITPEMVGALVDGLPEHVDVVTPSVFMDRLVANCKPAEE